MNTFKDYKKTTGELLEIIAKSRNSLDELMKDLAPEQLDMSLKDYFNMMMMQKDMTPAQVVKNSGLHSAYAYQIISGEKQHPSRSKLLALAFAMDMTVDETQQLLKVAHVPTLYPRNRQDLVILFALKEHYRLIDVNEVLQDLNEELLI